MKAIVVSLFLMALTGCASNVVTDYDSNAVFGNYSSWAFAPKGEDQSFTSLDGGRIESAVERELNRKAMRKVGESEADLLVTWQVVEEEREGLWRDLELLGDLCMTVLGHLSTP